ncbi:MAG TPA: hypothetical protein VIL74_17530 [Pyrinomonadaceae bacterium]|jgi:hypothetical protein
MKNKITVQTLFLAAAFFALSLACHAQTAQLIKKTTYRTETIEFGAGGTLSVTGAPAGSISIEGWNKPEVEISAEVEIQAPTEADLALLATLNTFVIDQGFNHTRIVSVGTFDRDFMKRTAKKFPKALVDMPFKIDYKIKVPRFCDLNITGGSGDFSLVGVDGEIFVKYLNSNAKMNLIGGSLQATFGGGTVDVTIPTRSWRGRFADVQLASGTMNVQLPLSFNAEVEAAVLRTGQIENSFAELKPKTKNAQFTERSISAKAGNGGVPLRFTVGDGALKISEVK